VSGIEPTYLWVGAVLRAHGLKGELRVSQLSDIAGRFDPGNRLRLVLPSGETRQVEIKSCRADREALLIRLDGVEDRNQAESLRGSRFEVAASESPDLPDGNYYFHELVGCAGFDRRAGALGVVVDVLEDGGGILLVFQRGDDELLVPFSDALLVEVDTDGKKIDFDLPDGLIEACSSKF
jgi:16S rRNA processing protein RimM